MPSTLLIRADASERIGTGHVMRMIALAQAWRRRGGKARFLCCVCPQGVRERVAEAEFPVRMIDADPGSKEDLAALLEIIHQENGARVVLDNYHFDYDYQKAVHAAASCLLVVDDYGHLDRYSADIVLNQNLSAEFLDLPARAPGAKFLLGTKFALLREEFLQTAPQDKPASNGLLNVLVTMGGGDPDNATRKVMDPLLSLAEHVGGLRVVVGGANPHKEQLESILQFAPFSANLLVNVNDMPSQMGWADVAICAGGSTCWELAYFGVPFAAMTLAENQRAVISALQSSTGIIDLGWHSEVGKESIIHQVQPLLSDVSVRNSISVHLRSLIDGNGASRVAAALDDCGLWLRRARAHDAQLLFAWANDAATRANSFSPDPIPLTEHQKWFSAKLASDESLLLICMNSEDETIGQIRFDRHSPKVADIDISIAPHQRGRGFGAALVELGIEYLRNEWKIESAVAKVKQSNHASIASFRKAGFTEAGSMTKNGEVVKTFRKNLL